MQDDADVASLVSMGFPESDARAALEHCAGATDIVNAAMEHLFSMTAQGATPMHTDADGEAGDCTSDTSGLHAWHAKKAYNRGNASGG